MKVKLGNTVRDIVSGFQGIATSKVEYLNGCIQFGIMAKAKDNKKPDAVYIDEGQLVFVDEGVSVAAKENGGDRTDTPKGIGLSNG